MHVISCGHSTIVDYVFIRYSKFTAAFPACSFVNLFLSVQETAIDPSFHLFQSLKRITQVYVYKDRSNSKLQKSKLAN